jgi:isopentenyl diphosphate isomerase/L-lactate dehydrogenase-like FMN-dependent dehydrogenase
VTSSTGPEHIFSLRDFEARARDVLSPVFYAYYAGGAGDEVTLRDNREAFHRRRLLPRVMRDVSSVDPSTTFLGEPVPFPVGLAPNAQQGFAHPEGEVATARAAKDSGALMCLSTLSTRSLEDVASAGDAPRWFQLYINKDHGFSKDLIRRACAAGYRAIVVTADLPVPGYRERELRHPVVYEHDLPFGNLSDVAVSGADLMSLLESVVDSSATWADIEWVRSTSEVPVLVKGIMTPQDARLAVDGGASGVVVSNHGGRQLDLSPATIEVLEPIVDEVGSEVEVYLDGGVTRGVDVALALSLGARGVFIGRPYLFALAVAGEDGVRQVLDLLRAEFENAMALLGVTRVAELGRRNVV